MKLEEEFVGRSFQFAQLLKRLADQIEADTLVVRGKKVELPDIDMEYKYSLKSDLGGNKFTVTIEWLDS